MEIDLACTKPSVGDCFVITKQSPTEGLVQAKIDWIAFLAKTHTANS